VLPSNAGPFKWTRSDIDGVDAYPPEPVQNLQALLSRVSVFRAKCTLWARFAESIDIVVILRDAKVARR